MSNKSRLIAAIIFFGTVFLLTACVIAPVPAPSPTPVPPALGAGFRFSTYGPPYDPGPAYWADVGQQMAAKFSGAKPQAIWIIGNYAGTGPIFTFP